MARNAGAARLPGDEPGKTHDQPGAHGQPTDSDKTQPLVDAIEDGRKDVAFQSRIRASMEQNRTILGKLSER